MTSEACHPSEARHLSVLILRLRSTFDFEFLVSNFGISNRSALEERNSDL
jgi:hypothetical protein